MRVRFIDTLPDRVDLDLPGVSFLRFCGISVHPFSRLRGKPLEVPPSASDRYLSQILWFTERCYKPGILATSFSFEKSSTRCTVPCIAMGHQERCQLIFFGILIVFKLDYFNLGCFQTQFSSVARTAPSPNLSQNVSCYIKQGWATWDPVAVSREPVDRFRSTLPRGNRLSND